MNHIRLTYPFKIISVSLFLYFGTGQEVGAQMSVGIKGSYYLSLSQSEELAYDDRFDFLSHKIRFIEDDISPVPEIFLQIENELVYLRTGLAYRQVNSRFRYRDFLDYRTTSYQTVIKNSKTLLFPLEAGLVYQNMKFGAGPSFTLNMAQTMVFTAIEELEERQRSFTGGYHLRFSSHINNLQFEIVYEQRFHGVADYLYYRGDSKAFQQTSRFISLGLAYIFQIN